jgi:membrane protein YqaA with SNARE-associated domain
MTLRVLALLVVVGLTLCIVLFRKQLAGLAVYGYPGVFLVSLIANATIILPAPSLAVVFASGTSLFPPFVGLAAGSGEALGELTGYLAGYSGSGIIENQRRYAQIERWMHRGGLWIIFLLSVIPNPFFDLAGMAAGAMQVPVWRFLAVCWTGKVIKTMWVAYAGAGSLALIERMLAH